MCEAIDAHIPGAVYEKPHGGYFLFLKLPTACRIDAVDLLEQTSTEQSIPITFTVGDACVAASDTEPDEFRRFLRLSFAFHTAEEIATGVTLLGRHIALHM
jgi:DNA-binding transcriptional MocR family regulator